MAKGAWPDGFVHWVLLSFVPRLPPDPVPDPLKGKVPLPRSGWTAAAPGCVDRWWGGSSVQPAADWISEPGSTAL